MGSFTLVRPVVCSQYLSTLILLTFSTAHPQRDGPVVASTLPPWLATSRGRPPPASLPCSVQRVPCSSRFRSLFRLAGKSGPGIPRSGSVPPRLPRRRPEIARIPCIFPADQGVGPRDGFARDWLHRQPVCGCRDFAPAPRDHLGNSRAFAGSWERGTAESEPETASSGSIAASWSRLFLCHVWRLRSAPRLASAKTNPTSAVTRSVFSLFRHLGSKVGTTF